MTGTLPDGRSRHPRGALGEANPGVGPRYEYRLLSAFLSDEEESPEALAEALDRAGAAGWRLVPLTAPPWNDLAGSVVERRVGDHDGPE